MNKHLQTFLILIVIACVSSCDYIDDNKGIKSLGDGYYFVNDGHGKPQITKEVSDSSPTFKSVIYHKIEDYAFNKDYILAFGYPTQQEINESVSNGAIGRVYTGGTPQFWIIEKRRDKLFGPLLKIDYLSLRRQLSVPANIKLNEE